MRRRFATLVIFGLVFPIWGAPISAMAASNSNQKPTSEELRPVEECQMSEAARDAIEEARAQLKQDKYRGQMIKLIDQAQAAARLPECDNEKAIELAEHAKRIAVLAALPGSEDYSESSKSSTYEGSSACWDTALATEEFGEKVARDTHPDAGLFEFSTGTTATLTGLLCLPTLTTEASTGGEETAYLKMQQYRLVAKARDNLAKDMARGGGEYVTAMAYLNGCSVAAHESFAQMTQRDFEQIFPKPDLDTETILLNLEAQIAKDPLLVTECSEVS